MQKAYKFVRVILGILVVLSVVLVEFAMYWQILDKFGGISAECPKINFWHFAFDLHKFFVDLQEFYNLQLFLSYSEFYEEIYPTDCRNGCCDVRVRRQWF